MLYSEYLDKFTFPLKRPDHTSLLDTPNDGSNQCTEKPVDL